jgi:hypothetical protein
MTWFVMAAVVAVILAVLAYFVFQVGYMVAGSLWATRQATQRAQEALAAELRALPTDALRSRLLADPHLVSDLKHDSGVQAFLLRLANGDEVALAQEYPRARLFKLLGRAEASAHDAPQERLVDTIAELSATLQALAARSSESGAGGPTRG